MASSLLAAKEDEGKNDEKNENQIRRSVVERYYTCRYCIDVFKQKGEDQCILIHSNRVCIVTVAQSHSLFTQNHKVKNISFQVSQDINRMNNKVSGKSKRGAQWLGVNAPLCKVTSDGGKIFTLVSCVKGQLIEVNEALIENPNLILEKPQTEGYIAIVLPRLDEPALGTHNLLTEEQYQEKLRERQSETQNI